MVRLTLIKNTSNLVQVVPNVQNQQHGTMMNEILLLLGKPLYLLKNLILFQLQ